jgi:invasion protein IalB
MKKLRKKLESIFIVILFCGLCVPSASSEEINTKKWVKKCGDTNNSCLIAIRVDVPVTNSEKKETLSTVFIKIGFNSKKEKTPVFFLSIPLDVNLKKAPLAVIDEKAFLNLSYAYCNTQEGCITQNTINDEGVNLLKASKELIITFADNKNKRNIKMKIPLKGFTKAYDSLTK